MTYIEIQNIQAYNSIHMYHCIYNLISEAAQLNIEVEFHKYIVYVTHTSEMLFKLLTK